MPFNEDEQYTSRRDEMLSRFRESLKRPLTDRYFDEDDLVEIFDFAGDVADDYLRMEALMIAARFYPDSEELNQRRALFYASFSDDVRDKYLSDNDSHEGVIWDIMRVRKDAPSAEAAAQSLTHILDSLKEQLNDEESIQFVQLASSLNQLQWLKDNLDRLLKVAEYPSVMYYEVAIAADVAGDPEYCVQMLDELTKLEPFNAYYWQMLAREYDQLDKYSEAMSAVEYALALSPDDAQALFAKAKIMYSMHMPFHEIADVLKRSIDNQPETSEPLRFMAYMYDEKGDAGMVEATLRRAISDYPEDELTMLPQLIQLNPYDIDSLLDRFFSLSGIVAEEMWSGWAHVLMSQGLEAQARSVIECYERNTGRRIPMLLTAEDNFKSGRFKAALEDLTDFLNTSSPEDADFPSVVIMQFLSLIKLRRYMEAYSLAKLYQDKYSIEDIGTIAGRLQYLGVVAIMNDFRNQVEHNGKPEDWLSTDPLKFWGKTSPASKQTPGVND